MSIGDIWNKLTKRLGPKEQQAENLAYVDIEDMRSNKQVGDHWLTRIENSRDYEKPYRLQAALAIERYKSERPDRITSNTANQKTRFPTNRNNLWYGIVNEKSANIMPEMPRLVLKKRQAKQGVLELMDRKAFSVICEIIEKALSYFIDTFPHEEYNDFMFDFIVTGRGVLWVNSKINQDSQTIQFERVPWYNFAIDPRLTWSEVKWVARRHFLNLVEFKKNFPDADFSKVKPTDYFNAMTDDDSYLKVSNIAQLTGDKYIEVWELWSKDTKEILFLSRNYDNYVCKKIKKEKNFEFPTPRPAVYVKNLTSMIPQSELITYASELDDVAEMSLKIREAVHVINTKGYTSQNYGDLVSKLCSVSDNTIVTYGSGSVLQEGKEQQQLIKYMDFEPHMKVINAINQQIQQTATTVYELSGIAGIRRSTQQGTPPTATSKRIDLMMGDKVILTQDKKIDAYLERLYQIGAHLICKHFSQETLEKITGMTYRHKDEVLKEIHEIEASYNTITEQIQNLQQMSQQLQQAAQQQPQQPMPDQGQQMPQDQGQDQGQMPPDQGGMPPDQGQDQGQMPPNPQDMQQQAQQMQQQLPELQQQQTKLVVALQILYSEVTWEFIMYQLRQIDLADYIFECDTDWKGLNEDPIVANQRIQFFQSFIQIERDIIPMMQQNPDVADVFCTTIMLNLDNYPMSRQMRGELEDHLFKMVENIKMQARMPKQQPPNPDLMKAQAAMQEAQARMMQAQNEQQKAQLEAQYNQQKLQVDLMIAREKAQVAGEYAVAQAQAKIQADTNKFQLEMEMKDRELQSKSQLEELKMRMERHKELEAKLQDLQNQYQKKQAENPIQKFNKEQGVNNG